MDLTIDKNLKNYTVFLKKLLGYEFDFSALYKSSALILANTFITHLFDLDGRILKTFFPILGLLYMRLYNSKSKVLLGSLMFLNFTNCITDFRFKLQEFFTFCFSLGIVLMLALSVVSENKEDKIEREHFKADLLLVNNVKNELSSTIEMSNKLMEQLAPTSILNSVDEKYSSYSVLIPTTSLTSFSLSLKHANHLANQLSYVNNTNKDITSAINLSNTRITEKMWDTNNHKYYNFKIDTIIQSVCDAMSGLSSRRKIEIVICNSNHNSFLNVVVSGEVDKHRHLLLNLLNTVIMATNEGASIEFSYGATKLESSINNQKNKGLCQIDYELKYKPLDNRTEDLKSILYPDANLFDKMVFNLKGVFTASEDTDGNVSVKLTFIMNLVEYSDYLQNSTIDDISKDNDDQKIKEYQDECLSFGFLQSIKNQKFVLYSREDSKFAQYLSSFLVGLGIEVIHQSTNQNTSKKSSDTTMNNLSIKIASLMIINDYLPVLENYINYIAIELATVSPGYLLMSNTEFGSHTKAPIIFFASLTNYQKVKDSIQVLLNKPNSFFFPPILVVPKPSGPMRIVTNIYTAISKRPVSSPFIPNSSPHGMHYTYDRDYFQIENIKGVMLNNKNRRNAYYPPNRSFNLYQMSSSGYKPSNDYFSIKTYNQQASSSTKNTEGLQPMKIKTPLSSPNIIKPNTSNEKERSRRSSKKDSNLVLFPPIKVLIVEDNPINLTILSTFMKKRKIEYDVAKNGQQAYEKWKSKNFDLVFMDIQLPVLDGIETTKIIRKEENFGKIKTLPLTINGVEQNDFEISRTPSTFENNRSPVIIVALTASSSNTDRNKALAAGCNDFLTKPVSLKWLEKKIIEWGSMKALINFEESKRKKVLEVSEKQKKVMYYKKPVEHRDLNPKKLVERKLKIIGKNKENRL